MSAPQSNVLTRREVASWRNAIFVTFGLSGFALSNWLSRVPAVRDQLQVDTAILGLVILGLAVGSILGLVVSSGMVARWGTARSVAFGLIVGAFGLPVAALGTQLNVPLAVFAGLAVFGFGQGLTDVAMNVAGAANERALGRTVMPLFHAVFSIGTVLGVGAGAIAEGLKIPLLIHLSVVAVLMIIVIVFTVRFYQPEITEAEAAVPSETPTHGWRARLSIWRDPRTLLIGLIALGMAFSEGSANDWLPLAMVDGHGVDNATGALVLGIFLFAMTFGRVAGVYLLDRFGRVPVLRWSSLLAAIGLVIVVFVPSAGVAAGGAVLWGLGTALGFPVAMSAAGEDPQRAAARVSAVATVGYLAFLAGPPLIGFLGVHLGILNALLVVLVLVALAGIAAPAARPSTPRSEIS